MNQIIPNFQQLSLLVKKNQNKENHTSFNYTVTRKGSIKRKGINIKIYFNRNKKSFSRKVTLIYYCTLIKLTIFSALFNRFNQNQI